MGCGASVEEQPPAQAAAPPAAASPAPAAPAAKKEPEPEPEPAAPQKKADGTVQVAEMKKSKIQNMKNKRVAVAAQALLQAVDEIKTTPKSKEIQKMIHKAVKDNPLFAKATTDLTNALIGTMSPSKFTDGQDIITQGDITADKFFVIEKGECDVYIKKGEDADEEKVQTLKGGDSFGELALLYNCPRNATIRANGPVACWVMEQKFYAALTRVAAEKALEKKAQLVDSVPSFTTLQEAHKAVLIDALEQVEFFAGNFIMKKGEVGDRFYIIQEGEVSVQDEKGTELSRLAAGAFFGERALINDDVRQASVVALTPVVVCLSLNRQSFLDLLGPLEDAWRWTSLREVELLATLSDSHITQLTPLLEVQNLSKGQTVFEKGDEGDYLYIIESGAYVIMDCDIILATLDQKGKVFGELALLNSDTRVATCGCTKDGKLLKLSREKLEGSVGSLKNIQMAWREDALRRVALLSKLTPTQRRKLAQALIVKMYSDREIIIEKGTTGDAMYIIERGSVLVVDNNDVERKLTQGAYFGEVALLKKDTRSKTIVCKGPCSVLEITQHSFEEVLGPLQDILDKQVESYDSVGQKITIKSLSELRIKAVLGMGAFGKVLLVHYRGKPYALKCLVKQQILQVGLQAHLMQERHIMMDCASPYLVNLRGTFKDKDSLYMIMETVMGGELFRYLQNLPAMCVSEKDGKFYTACTFLAFEYLHERGYCHRDLKPENLLIGVDGYLKLADFGFAKKVKNTKTFTTCGTPDYMAPEIVSHAGHTLAVDWWALGVLIYEMVTGTTPFYSLDDMERVKLIHKGKPVYPSSLSSPCKDIMRQLLTVNPGKRLGSLKGGSGDVRKHAWFKSLSWGDLLDRRVPAPYVPGLKNTDDTSCFDNYEIDAAHPAELNYGPNRLKSHGCFDDF